MYFNDLTQERGLICRHKHSSQDLRAFASFESHIIRACSDGLAT